MFRRELGVLDTALSAIKRAVKIDQNDNLNVPNGEITQEGIPVLDSLQVDSVSALQSGSYPASLDRIWLSGYYGVGTPGGGPLYRDSADTTTADNGGTVFVDADGVRWKRPPKSFYDVTEFGAKGDGAANDNAAIHAALDAADRGETVYIPAGIYLYDTEILTLYVNIVGDGYRAKSRGPKDADGYQDDSRYDGSILRFTASTGVAITAGRSDTEEYSPRLEGFMVIGATGNSATGIKPTRLLSGRWSNVKAANFDICWNIDWAEDCLFEAIRASGGNTGIYSNTNGTNQNTFVNTEVNACDVGMNLIDCRLNIFYGGLVQGGDTLVDGVVLGEKSRYNAFHDFWFEATWSGDLFRTEGVDNYANRLICPRIGQPGNTITLGGLTGGDGIELGRHLLEDIETGGGTSASITIGADLGTCWIIRPARHLTITDNSKRSVIMYEDGAVSPWTVSGEYDRGESRQNSNRAFVRHLNLDEGSAQYLEQVTGATSGELLAVRILGSNLEWLDSGGNRTMTLDYGSGDLTAYGSVRSSTYLQIPDGTSEPGTFSGIARMYIDSVDGDLKIKFSDGTVKTIVTDT